jgi:hypothetical protein
MLMQLYCFAPMRFLTYMRAFATVSRYLGFGVVLRATTIGDEEGDGTTTTEAKKGSCEEVGAALAAAEGSSTSVAEAARDWAEGDADDTGFGSASAWGITTTTASSRITHAAAIARSTAGENRFNCDLRYHAR